MVRGIPNRRFSQAMCFGVGGLLIAGCIGCGGSAQGSTGGPTPTPTPGSSPSPTPTPGSAGAIEMSVASATVPTGGIFQYQLSLTEPKPIGNSSTRPNIPSGPVGPVRGVAVNDSSGQAVGIAVVNDTTIAVSIDSPNASLGTDVDYPLLILTMPVVATSGQFPISMDPSSTFFNGSNQYTIQTNNPGTLTIGGTMSITDVIPGGGLIAPGDNLRILGMGFDANTKIQMNNVATLTQNFVSATEIDVTIGSLCVPESNPCKPATSLQLDGDRVRAIKGNETVEYFSYDRTDDAPGSSNNSVVNLVHPMFSQQHFVTGTFPFKAGGTQFTGIALQNTDASVGATVQIDLLDANGNPVVSPAAVLLVGARKKLVRDIADLFTGIPSSAATVRATVTTGPPVKMLGMLGDTSSGSVVPVVVTGQ